MSSWTPTDYDNLKAWMDANPASVDGKTDHEIAEDYNGQTAAGPEREIEAREFFSGLQAGEVAEIQNQALDDKATNHSEAAALSYWFDQIGSVSVSAGSATRGYIDSLVAGGVISQASLDNLIAAAQTTIPLWQSTGAAREANHGDVAWVRREM